MAPNANAPIQEGEPSGAAPSTAATIDQVRELLFGAHQRDLERKLARVENQLHADAEELRNETRRRLEALESHVRRETNGLGERVDAEQNARNDAVAAASRDAREALAGLEQRIGKLEHGLARVQRETNQLVLEQAKRLFDELERVRQEMLAAWERDVGLLRGSQEREAAVPRAAPSSESH